MSDESSFLLEEPIFINDLMKNGSSFQITSDFNDIEDDDEENFLNMDNESDEIIINNPWNNSFDELRANMTKIDDNIYKCVTKIGIGNEIPVKARIKIHYNAFFERESNPFDSTTLNGCPLVFLTGEFQILPGLEMATVTMKKGEEAQFLISYKLLYGEMGCPPRIKKRSDSLFIITLIDFSDIGDENAHKKISDIDKDNFEVVLDNANKTRMAGIDQFNQKRYKAATITFHNAIKSLEGYNLKNAEEETKQRELIIKLYTNLTVCYNQLNLPKKTCLMCNELSKITKIDKLSKVLYQKGKALRLIGDYDQATNVLNMAKKLEPNNSEINSQLQQLDKITRENNRHEREMYRKAFGLISLVDSEKNKKMVNLKEDDVTEQFRNEFMNTLNVFIKNDNVKTYELPIGLTIKEIEWLRTVAEQQNIHLQSPSVHRKDIYTLVKKNSLFIQ